MREDRNIVASLTSCTKQKDLREGARLHGEILRKGLLEKNCYIASTLINMYAKCGAFVKAVELLKGLTIRDVVSWNALIAAYAHQGQSEEALKCYEQMRNDGISPNTVTFTCILKACGNAGAYDKGVQFHSEIVRQGLLGEDIQLGNAIADMYAKCGVLAIAAQVLDELYVRNVMSWNVLITGYAQHGHSEEALECYDRMRNEGIVPDIATYIYVMKACAEMGAADKGEEIQREIVRQGLLGKSIVLGTALVDMYAKCTLLAKSVEVFDELPIRNVVSWNALLAGYAQQEQGNEALRWFKQMQSEGLIPNSVTFTCILKACGSIGAVDKGEHIHEEIGKQGLLEKDFILGTMLMDMYIQCGALAKAIQVLDKLPVRSVASWNTIISGYLQQGQTEEVRKCVLQMQSEGLSPNGATLACMLRAFGSQRSAGDAEVVHEQIIRQGLLGQDCVLGTTLVDMYVRQDALAKAEQVFDALSVHDVVTWNALLAGYSQQGQIEEALRCFECMLREGLMPDKVSFTCLLKAYGNIGIFEFTENILNIVGRYVLLECDLVLCTTLVDVYFKCGALTKAAMVFDKLSDRDIVSWNALIAGYVQHGQSEDALECLEQMWNEGFSPDAATVASILKVCRNVGAVEKGEQIHDELIKFGALRNDIVLMNLLVDMYAKCGAILKAARVFDELAVRDVVSWCTLIAGLSLQGHGGEALNCFEQMQREGLSPDVVTFNCILKACSSIGATYMGECIHDKILRLELLGKDDVLGNTIVDMYAKCGELSKAAKVLEELPVRGIVSWSALISGYAQQGQGGDALKCLGQLQYEGLSPDALTLSSVLSACSRSGLMDEAQIHFADMKTKYGIIPEMEHHTCMVDLFGRIGEFDKACTVIREMPENYLPAWHSVLGACLKCGNTKVGRLAFEKSMVTKQNDILYAC